MNHRRFLFQGDSITDANRGRTEDPNHIMGHSYAFSIASRLMADFPELGLEFFNRGVGGDSHVEMEQRWQKDCLDLCPDVLSILIGTNGSRQACGIYAPWDNAPAAEADPAQSLEAYESALRRMLTAVRKAKPETLLVLCLPFRYPAMRWTQEENQKIVAMVQARAEVVRKVAEEFNAVLVDFPAALDRAIALNNDRAYWSWDGVHVTVAGHEILAREWLRSVRKHISFLKDYPVCGRER